MSHNILDVLGVKISAFSQSDILEKVRKYLRETRNQRSEIRKRGVKPLVIFTPNPEIINFTVKNPFFRETVNKAQINIPDGWGVVWAVEKLHKVKIKKISGSDLVEKLVKLSCEMGVSVGLIGGKEKVAVRALECLQKKYPGVRGEVLDESIIKLQITNYKSSSFAKASADKQINTKSSFDKSQDKQIPNSKQFPDKDSLNSYFIIHDSRRKRIDSRKYFSDLVRKIIRKKIGIVFVALGFPKQEHFIELLTYHMSRITCHQPIVLMSVGGSFDYISGEVKRAPLWMRDLGFEWLYRLVKEPWRWRRQMEGAKFFWNVLRSV